MATNNQQGKKNQVDWLWGALTLIMLLSLIGILVYSTVTGKEVKATLVEGLIIGQFTTLINFRYGSSQSSKHKTDLLAQAPPIPENN